MIPAIEFSIATMPVTPLRGGLLQGKPSFEGPRYLIGGRLKQWAGECEIVKSPLLPGNSEEAVLGRTPLLTEKAALNALDAADNAWGYGSGNWPMAETSERIKAVNKFIEELLLRKSRITDLLMWEVGKTKVDATREFDRTIEFLRKSIVTYQNINDDFEVTEDNEGLEISSGLLAVGRLLCMGPANYPLNETLTTLIPALLVGNTAIVKTPKFGALIFNPVMEAMYASFPEGVVNVISGDGPTIVKPIMESGKIDGLAFIGSPGAAKAILASHPKRDTLRKVLGLSAKNMGLLLPDADLDVAISECLKGSLSFNGQRCTALKILFVHRSHADDFATKFSKAVENLQVGFPWEDGVSLTPLYDPTSAAYLSGLVQDAKDKGAKILNAFGGEEHGEAYIPAVLYPVTPKMRVYKEEQFGPVIPIVVYDSIEEAFEFLRELPFGQQVSVFGHEINRRSHLLKKLLLMGGARANINTQCQRGPDDIEFSGRGEAAFEAVSIQDSLSAFSVQSYISSKKVMGINN